MKMTILMRMMMMKKKTSKLLQRSSADLAAKTQVDVEKCNKGSNFPTKNLWLYLCTRFICIILGINHSNCLQIKHIFKEQSMKEFCVFPWCFFPSSPFHHCFTTKFSKKWCEAAVGRSTMSPVSYPAHCGSTIFDILTISNILKLIKSVSGDGFFYAQSQS